MVHRVLAWLLDQYTEMVAATRFLSVLPLLGPPQHFETSNSDTETSQLKLGSAYFPFVGFLLATVLYLVQLIFGLVLPRFALAAILVVALVLLTGGLHLDGLMDTCDGLFGGRTRERRLEIMRDSRVGSFGVLGGICILLLKFALFASMGLHTLSLAFFVVLPSTRWAMVLALRTFPSARPGGLGATFRQSVTLPKLLVAGVTALVFVFIVGHAVGILLWIAASCTALLIGAWVTRLIGGLTGDIYGAIAESTEVIALLVLVSMHAFL